MKALALTTRFREGSFEGDACLLVYDDTNISGSSIGDDFRDVLERRPNTPRIFVLAPFLKEEEVEAAVLEGSALRRAGAVSKAATVDVSVLGLSFEGDQACVMSRSYFLDDDRPVIGEWRRLHDALREGWLFNLFDANGGLVDSPIGVHFSKASGKHAIKFLRTSSVLLSTAACGVMAFFALGATRQLEPRRIFVDTAPLLSLAFAMQRIAMARGFWKHMPPAKSFSSYGGVGKLPRLANSDLILVSASTSGGLADRLIGQGVAEDMLLTLYLLKSGDDMNTKGRVLCDLTYRPQRTFGYPPIVNHSAESCELCKRGYVLAELEGDQFLLEKRAVKRLRVGAASQTAEARKSIETLARTGAISVRLHRQDTRRTDIDIDLQVGLALGGFLEVPFSRLLMRFTPTPLNLVIAVGLTADDAKAYCIQAGLATAIQSAQFVEGDYVGQLAAQTCANALVIIGHLCDHAVLRGINAQLRPKVIGGCVAYVSAFTVADSARNLADLRIFLSYGEHGPDTFTFRSALELMLPWTGEQYSPWAQELQLWRRLRGDNKLPDLLQKRLHWLQETASASGPLFLPGKDAELAIAPDFVLLDTSKNIEKISQADVYAVVCNALATARCDNQGLKAMVQRGNSTPVWSQTVYGQCVLCPSNFRDFNDAVLRAALLRAASIQELNYSVDEVCSEEMRDVIRADINSWGQGRGDALPEFLLSMACGRLRLVRRHVEQLKSDINSAILPDHLKTLALSIAEA
jgi:hypothetical protein